MRWRPTGDGSFPYACRLEERWWVLRVNAFPDHPLYTVLVDGRFDTDLEDWPAAWERAEEPVDATEALAGVRGFTAYGSESGDPCGCPYC